MPGSPGGHPKHISGLPQRQRPGRSSSLPAWSIAQAPAPNKCGLKARATPSVEHRPRNASPPQCGAEGCATPSQVPCEALPRSSPLHLLMAGQPSPPDYPEHGNCPAFTEHPVATLAAQAQGRPALTLATTRQGSGHPRSRLNPSARTFRAISKGGYPCCCCAICCRVRAAGCSGSAVAFSTRIDQSSGTGSS